MLFDEFDMVYDDWMIERTIEIKKTKSAKDLFRCALLKYQDKEDDNAKEKLSFLYDKALVLQQKLSMMNYAEYNIHNIKAEFENTQNMEIPALYGMGKTIILFYFESMIVFARNALDVAATIYADLFFDKRTDSFNDFSKWILNTEKAEIMPLKKYLNNSNNNLCVYRLLCGSQKGRALRDIIIHQTNVKLVYSEYKENSEKERLFLQLKNMPLIDLDLFVLTFIDEVEELFNITNKCCEEYLNNSIL